MFNSYNEKYGFVYLWFDRKHKRYYIGAHWGSVDDGYICSSKWMKQAYRIRPEDFKRKILTYIFTNKSDMFDREAEWMSFIKPNELKEKYYNIHNVNKNHWSAQPDTRKVKEKLRDAAIFNHTSNTAYQEAYLKGVAEREYTWSDENKERHINFMIDWWEEKSPKDQRRIFIKMGTEEHKEMLSSQSKLMWENPEYRAKQEFIMKERWQDQEYQEKISKARTGLKFSEEHKRKIGDAHRGRKATDEARKNMSEAQKGLKRSPEAIRKGADARRGIPRSEETKQILSEQKKGKPLSEKNRSALKRQSFYIDGKHYTSYTDAATDNGVSVQTIINRLKNNNFTGYSYTQEV